MKTLIKIVVSLVVLTACVSAGRAAFNNFQFEDAVQQRLLFDARATDAEVVDMVLELAAEYDVPLEESGVSVSVVGPDRVVEMTYTTEVTLVPGVYSREWTFGPRASTRLLNSGR